MCSQHSGIDIRTGKHLCHPTSLASLAKPGSYSSSMFMQTSWKHDVLIWLSHLGQAYSWSYFDFVCDHIDEVQMGSWPKLVCWKSKIFKECEASDFCAGRECVAACDVNWQVSGAWPQGRLRSADFVASLNGRWNTNKRHAYKQHQVPSKWAYQTQAHEMCESQPSLCWPLTYVTAHWLDQHLTKQKNSGSISTTPFLILVSSQPCFTSLTLCVPGFLFGTVPLLPHCVVVKMYDSAFTCRGHNRLGAYAHNNVIQI